MITVDTGCLLPANHWHFLPCAIAIHQMSPELSSVDKLSSADKANNNWLPWQRALRDQKTNFRLIIYGHNSTNPAKLVKIGLVLVEVEVIGLKGLLK